VTVLVAKSTWLTEFGVELADSKRRLELEAVDEKEVDAASAPT